MAAPLDAFPDLTDETDRELVARHQRVVRELEGVGVDGLVYEYRTQFHRDPLVTQDRTAYYLSVRSHVWEEFADRMDLTDDELARLKRCHAEQFAASVGEAASADAMILTKE
ncbi:hypothetical protein M0R89_19635 (plasmid) [Halorussus limi]|uniref:DUF8048 domain-containing protein n=1 Tax=Halorussus limi TaxID=2938695 RepID=A0A8U0I0Q2_9EURY|nr:hypothetical protein [Halorussus limi]UPV76374.1 hypothetical protein M0R89_19635 [Halorussus limi]